MGVFSMYVHRSASLVPARSAMAIEMQPWPTSASDPRFLSTSMVSAPTSRTSSPWMNDLTVASPTTLMAVASDRRITLRLASAALASLRSLALRFQFICAR